MKYPNIENGYVYRGILYAIGTLGMNKVDYSNMEKAVVKTKKRAEAHIAS
jgi:hypothetical protein